MPSVLITGADFGLGPELIRQYARDGFQVFAACASRTRLGQLDGKVTVLPYDGENPVAAEHLIDKIADAPLDIAILDSTEGCRGDLSVADIPRVDWIAAITAGTFAPAKLAVALRSNLERGRMKRLVGISSFSASIGGCRSRNSYALRASKAALNSLWRTFSIEWKPLGICCLAVANDYNGFSRSTSSADEHSADSAFFLRRLVDQATLEDSGQFFGVDGSRIPW